MAQFITRVELHGVKHGDESYDILHKAMESKGFIRTIKDSDGTTYHLLTAEYYAEGDFTIQDVVNAARSAANETSKKYSVFTSEFTKASWYNLDEV